AAVLLFGLAPARRGTRLDLNRALASSGGHRSTRRVGISQVLVSAEVAVVMVLVMMSGLLIRSFMNLTGVDPGFRSANRLAFDIELPRLPASVAAANPLTPAERRQRLQRQTLWLAELEQRLQSLPGIAAAGASNAFPLTADAGGWGVNIAGTQLPPSTSMAMVSPGYFDTVGAPVVAGSNFSPATDSIAGSKALIVNQAMARLLFPDGNAIGKHVNAPRCDMVSASGSRFSDCVIVGIARDIRFSLDSPAPPTFYYSLNQDSSDRVTYVARAAQNPA